MREKNFGIDEKIDIKLDFMSKYLKNRRNSNSMVDFIMYTNILLDKLFSEEEKRRIKSNRFFVDTKDIKDERLKKLFETENENRKRGVFFRANGNNYIISLNPNEYLKLNDSKWDSLVKDNNIFVRPVYFVKLLPYLKKNNGTDRNIVHHNEFLKSFSKFEHEMLEDGFDYEEIKKHIFMTEKSITTEYKDNRTRYEIEDGNLVIYDENKKIKRTVLYEDEGRKIEYLDEELEK